MGAYEDNHRHLIEPASPSERRDAVSVQIADYEALWLTDVLREYAHYGESAVEGQDSIAVGYASYIDQKVREEGESHVSLYAHTELAAETLLDALYYDVPKMESRDDYPMAVFRTVETLCAEAFAEYIDL